eukprot:SAG11_NODE_1646_length_4523_cov_1.447559_5_plen_80_part_00
MLAGLFWFTLPTLLVIFNDSGAYFSGFLLGRKLIKRHFMRLSPNKARVSESLHPRIPSTMPRTHTQRGSCFLCLCQKDL